MAKIILNKKGFKFFSPIALTVCISLILTLTVSAYSAGGNMKGSLCLYSYSSSGDMIGSSHSVEFKREGDFVIITKFDAVHHADRGVSVRYKAPLESLNEIKAVFERYSMKNWPTERVSRFFAFDAPTSRFFFSFSNPDETLSYTTAMDLPDDAYEGMKALREVENKYIKEENKIK